MVPTSASRRTPPRHFRLFAASAGAAVGALSERGGCHASDTTHMFSILSESAEEMGGKGESRR